MFNNVFSSIVSEGYGAVAAPLSYLPSIILAIVVFVVGLVFAWLVQRVIESLFKAMPFIDKSLKDFGLEKITQRAGMGVNLGKFFGVIFKFFVIVIALVASLDILGFQKINDYLVNDVLTFIPKIIVASIIIIVGYIIANFVEKSVSSISSATRVSGGMASVVAKYAIIIFSVLTALSELGVAVEIINSLIVGVIAAISLALGLAFGLGGQEAAAEKIDEIKKDIRK